MIDRTAQVRLSPPATVVRQADPDRFVLVMMAPPARREALFALLALNVEAARIPETVSEPLLGAMRLRYWRDVIAAADPEAAATSGNPVAEALVREVLATPDAASVGERRRLLDSLLDGWSEALGADPPADGAAARRHAGAIGGSVWDLAGLLLGVMPSDGETRAALRHVGTAWLLLGVARATPVLLRRGRVRLPLDALARAGVSADAVLNGADRDRVGIRAGVAALTALALAELTVAGARRDRLDRRARPLLRQAIHGRHLARVLARHDHDPFAAGARLDHVPLLRLLLSTVTGGQGL
ncbi:squalene/phytoene synthase family protein [Roseospira visakhapatnamensis]|uniref:Phytoene synthase n=1 Tax=Roseospira visakhapatnamensis TaxID=390880 RepID=A0A7W6REG6_9PROT|nr:squalene/phytoene synthase family protein [Roseospira visakhapatnamensis]MBB4266817.1 phytoene synthase [Roseospira visakhapatnamensis]